jgi:hypothetical protein
MQAQLLTTIGFVSAAVAFCGMHCLELIALQIFVPATSTLHFLLLLLLLLLRTVLCCAAAGSSARL